ncbi:GntR family transcriptional regulator [Microbacteriaceae bacterium VKM Ac-2854]|nr:GntR family transcriptional regulator [Microbacteriaceae bacterium VKM Ac-2854]
MDDGRPLFVQIAERIENDIVDGTLTEEGQAPSTNELAAFLRINPATAAKGVGLLVDEGILYKRRGIGMFVAAGARDSILARRREQFAATFLDPLIAEAGRIGMTPDDLADLIRNHITVSKGQPA